jgi:hypothetical protein
MDSAVRTDETMTSAIEELKTIIRSYDPNAHFEVAAGPDAGDVYLVTTVDTDDADDVMDLYIDRLVEMQVDDRLPLYVMTLPSTREASDRQGSRNSKRQQSTV